MDFDKLIVKLFANEPFTFTRWGDGEWSSVLALEPDTRVNTDGHNYFQDMGIALSEILINRPEYYLGMQRFAREERFPKQIGEFLEANKLNDLNWINADIWHHASIKGYFEKFLDVLQKRQVLLVGPQALKEFAEKQGWDFQVVPDNNCWLYKESTIYNIHCWCKDLMIESVPGVVLVCASMPANYIIDQLYDPFGSRHTFLDMGSVFMPYVGKSTRRYHKKIIQRLDGKDIQ